MALKPISIFAIDPGGTTGWSYMEFAVATIRDRMGIRPSVYHCGEYEGRPEEHVDRIMDSIDGFGPDTIICMEDFTLRQLAVELQPVIIASMVEYALWDGGYTNPYIKQQVSDAKGTATDARLRLWGLWAKGSDHKRDANRHVMTLARKMQNEPELLLKLAPWIG